jgi:hypothetical protein
MVRPLRSTQLGARSALEWATAVGQAQGPEA